MTLRKLTLAIGLLAASLILAAPAQAETWSCSYSSSTGKAYSIVFIREGESFTAPAAITRSYSIIHEDDKQIHLYHRVIGPINPNYMMVVTLFKDHKEFRQAMLGRPTNQGGPASGGGSCMVH